MEPHIVVCTIARASTEITFESEQVHSCQHCSCKVLTDVVVLRCRCGCPLIWEVKGQAVETLPDSMHLHQIEEVFRDRGTQGSLRGLL